MPGSQGKVVLGRLQYKREKNRAADMRASLLLGVVLLGFGSAVSAREAEREFDFDIPQQPVHTALMEFAEQADLTLVFPDDVVGDKFANDLIGRYRLQEGADILLAGTGLAPTFSEQNRAEHFSGRPVDERGEYDE